MIAVVMGVSGAGKSAIGAALARELGWRFIDADDYHPEANVAKMAAGQPLDDADRWPWLDALTAILRREKDAILAALRLRNATACVWQRALIPSNGSGSRVISSLSTLAF